MARDELTAETVTDEDIRELRDTATPGDHDTILACNQALSLKPDRRNARSVQRARARCAALINARRKGPDQ